MNKQNFSIAVILFIIAIVLTSGVSTAQSTGADNLQGFTVDSFDNQVNHAINVSGTEQGLGFVIAVDSSNPDNYALANPLDPGGGEATIQSEYVQWTWDGLDAVKGWSVGRPDIGDDIYFVGEINSTENDSLNGGLFWTTWRNVTSTNVADPDASMVSQLELIPTPVAINVNQTFAEIEVDRPSYTDFDGPAGSTTNQGSFEAFGSYAVFVKGAGFTGWEYIGDTQIGDPSSDPPITPDPFNAQSRNPANNDTGTHVFNTSDAGVTLDPGSEYQFKVRANIDGIADVPEPTFQQFGDSGNYTTQANSSVLTINTVALDRVDGPVTLDPAEGEVVDSEIGELTSVPPVPEFNVEIIDIPSSVEAGDEVNVNVLVENNVRELGFVEYEVVADVANTGSSSGEVTFDLRLNGEVVDSKTVDFPPGALSGTEQIAFSGVLDEPGTYTVEVGTALVGEIDVPGGRQDTQDIIFMVEGAEIDREEVTLDHRESTEIQFTYQTSEEDVGSLLFEVFSDDDNASAEVVVNETIDDEDDDEDGLGLTTILGILILLLILLILIFLYMRWRRMQSGQEQDRFEI